MLKDAVAVGCPPIEIIHVSVAINIHLFRIRGADVERVAAGHARSTLGGGCCKFAFENSDPAITLSGVDAKSRTARDVQLHVRRIHAELVTLSQVRLNQNGSLNQIQQRQAPTIREGELRKFQLSVFREAQNGAIFKLDFSAAISRRQAIAFLNRKVHWRVPPVFVGALVLNIARYEAEAHDPDVRIIALSVRRIVLRQGELRAASGKNRDNKQNQEEAGK